MHWSEWAALVFVAIAVVPLGMALFYAAFLAWGMVAAVLEGRKPLRTAETEFGPFVMRDRRWLGDVQAHRALLRVSVKDVGGQPNPELLARLPDILERLPQLEQVARQQIPGITERHELSSVSDSLEEDVEFTLHFDYDEEAWGETVSVYFRGDQVVGSLVFD